MVVRVFTHPAEFQELDETQKLVYLATNMGEEIAGYAHLVFGSEAASEDQIKERYGEVITVASRSFTSHIDIDRREDRRQFVEDKIWNAIRRRSENLRQAPVAGTS